MKKILFLLAMLMASVAHATQSVQIVWPFNIGSTQAQMIRALIDNANKSQSKYQFVLVNKLGASGVIATNYTLSNDSLTVLGNSTSFFLTPLTTNGKTYDVDNFKIVAHLCSKRPMAIMSKNLKSLTDKKEITVGDIGGGSVLVGKVLESNIKKSTSILFVPYKGGPEATTDMLGGHLDVSIDWLSQANRAEGSGGRVLGITGNRKIDNHNPIKGLEELTFDLFLFLPSTVNDDTRKELNTIFNANNNGATTTFCDSDYGIVATTPFANLNTLFLENKKKWENLSNIK